MFNLKNGLNNMCGPGPLHVEPEMMQFKLLAAEDYYLLVL